MDSGLASVAALARIGLYARSETRLFMIALARRLKQQYGSAIVLYCGNAQEIAYYRTHGADVFAEIVEAKVLHQVALEQTADEAAEIERARAFEARIGQTINFVSVSNRHLGRGYALGGFYHPRSPSSAKTRYVNLLHAYNECLGFWDREIAARRLTLIVNGPREAAIMARIHGVPYRVFAGSRYRNYHNWAWNEFHENPEFQDAFRAREGADEAALDQPYHSHLVNRTRYMRDASFLRACRRALREVARFAWWRFRGYRKGRGYYLRDNLRMIFRIWSEARRLARLATTRLDDLKGKRFVYYPLHQEPEMALQGISPEYFYQLSLIAAVARDLPAGVRLAVKETFGAIGRRPRDFYRQIAEFKNVVLLQSLELGLECARRADAIVTICGTGGFEAAVMGKPVVTPGIHNSYNGLPQVSVVTREAELAEHLRRALDPSFDTAAAREVGTRFLRAVVARSFSMGGYDFIDVAKFEPSAVEAACSALVRGLHHQARASQPMATAAQ
jgi:hypothetical protein